ncbi:GNAT family N-acetyltransferase, putative [Talaromyces stipitatus ATCC 10500]|uniref:GNAT family N-acetyltransferase, putative n=1 Tax=Talaromyces stipitatus (strain ATCC 10500 / CBS 375.48 / QM 6759 / NRRL 1006) TaxID=441959 RepID=B8LTD4_TALSN|nr:GNAT family N-acetyltransferase, putative [Talaromyces stipitatus ATCC 10500]EED23012.1 GNAT family N-acetyltransferase, putative [Talaromyces stipitatus ATCC 10500]
MASTGLAAECYAQSGATGMSYTFTPMSGVTGIGIMNSAGKIGNFQNEEQCVVAYQEIVSDCYNIKNGGSWTYLRGSLEWGEIYSSPGPRNQVALEVPRYRGVSRQSEANSRHPSHAYNYKTRVITTKSRKDNFQSNIPKLNKKMARQLPPGYSLHIGYPPAEIYCNLRKTSGLAAVSLVQAQAVPKGSWYGCMIKYTPSESSTENAIETKPEIVAMGRIISDGGWYFVIADMAVLPSHQRKGLGDYVLKQLIQRIRAEPVVADVLENGGPKPYVNLLADEPGRKLYERNGFVYTAPHSLGMMLKLD